MLLFEAKLSLKSRRQVTKSMEGQDKIHRSDSKSLGPETHVQCQTYSVLLHLCYVIFISNVIDVAHQLQA